MLSTQIVNHHLRFPRILNALVAMLTAPLGDETISRFVCDPMVLGGHAELAMGQTSGQQKLTFWPK